MGRFGRRLPAVLKLTKKADYSLIALKHFAAVRLPDGSGAAALSAKELAHSSGIPLPLLSKLLQKLGKSGFLISEYGTNGGYRLAREPRDISAPQVIRAIDGPIVWPIASPQRPPVDTYVQFAL